MKYFNELCISETRYTEYVEHPFFLHDLQLNMKCLHLLFSLTFTSCCSQQIKLILSFYIVSVAIFSFPSHCFTWILLISHLSYFTNLITGFYFWSHGPSNNPVYCGYNHLSIKLPLSVNSPETHPIAYRIKCELAFDCPPPPTRSGLTDAHSPPHLTLHLVWILLLVLLKFLRFVHNRSQSTLNKDLKSSSTVPVLIVPLFWFIRDFFDFFLALDIFHVFEGTE